MFYNAPLEELYITIYHDSLNDYFYSPNTKALNPEHIYL